MLSDIPHRIVLAWGWRRALIALAAGAASALAMPPVDAFPVLFVTLPVLVWLIDGTAAGAGRLAALLPAAVVGWCFGFGYFIAGLWWIGAAFLVDAKDFAWLMPFAVIALPAGLALFHALALVVARLLWTWSAVRVLALALSLGGAEWLRGHVLTGFPWNSLGYALADNPWLGQAASLVGMEGLTPIAIAIFAAPATLIAGAGWRRWQPTAFAIAALLALAIFGAVRLQSAGPVAATAIKVRIVQPVIPEDDKFRPDRKADIVQRFLALSDEATGPASSGVGDFSLLVWPESAFPFFLERNPDVLAAIGRLLPATTTLITGAARAEVPDDGSAPRFYNSIRVITGDGQIVGTYDKVHLVPFGEFLPWQALLERLGFRQLTRLIGGFTAGSGPRLLLLPDGLKVAPMICYEAIFPGAAEVPGQRADALVNVTNDAWFGDTPGPRQHFAQARVRAVEEGLPLVRAANNGISAIVDPYGRITADLRLDDTGVVDGLLPPPLPQTLFATAGELAVAGVYGALALTLFAGFRHRI
ncbi:MAG TPA: apolipoprotein N-acyltransferase [Hyphomicrobiales bacterium]|nr:apolipoprotein N-acyltransferase [Hyphomicrobiales bacterium]